MVAIIWIIFAFSVLEGLLLAKAIEKIQVLKRENILLQEIMKRT